MENPKKYRQDYLYICNSDKMIKDSVCSGVGCRLLGMCSHTHNEYYAKNKLEHRYFDYYQIVDDNEEILEIFFEIEKES